MMASEAQRDERDGGKRGVYETGCVILSLFLPRSKA